MKQFVDFAAVGGIAFLIDYSILMFLSQQIGWNPVFSAFISYVVSTVFNYLASMRFVFKHRDDLSKKREFVLFVIFSLIGLLMNEIIIWIGTQSFGNGAFAVTASKLVATVIVAIWNFFSRKHWLDASA
jgi:putative flippase GtrA